MFVDAGGSDEDDVRKDDIAVLTPYSAQVSAIGNVTYLIHPHILQVRALSDGYRTRLRAEVSSKLTTPLSQLSVYTVDEFQVDSIIGIL